MKNILYIHQYFKTPEEGGALRSYFIATALVKRGFHVSMITTGNQPDYERKVIDRMAVHYLPIRYSNNMSFFWRYVAFFKFVISAIKLSAKIPTPDLIYATSTPLTVGLIALWLKWRKNIPFLFEVRDLWPEAPIQLGVMKNRILKLLALKLEKSIYSQALKIIALSPGIEQGIRNTAPESKISTIPNMSDIQFFQEYALSSRRNKVFSLGYFGAFGMANNMEFIIQSAKSCMDQRLPIRFILAGDGAKKEFLEESKQRLYLTNIEIHPPKNRTEVRAIMSEVDACLTSFLKIPVLETNSPNKFFDGLAAGKLCIVNTSGWLKELVEENQCGIYIDPDLSEAFPELIRPFVEDKSLLEKYQKNALSLGNSTFSREKLTEKVCTEVKSLFS